MKCKLLAEQVLIVIVIVIIIIIIIIIITAGSREVPGRKGR